MKERGLLVIVHINMIDSIFVQNRRDGVFNGPKLDANVATTGAKAHDGILIGAFFGPDRRILSIYQHPRPEQKEVTVVAGVDIKLRVYFVYYTLHRDSRQRDEIE